MTAKRAKPYHKFEMRKSNAEMRKSLKITGTKGYVDIENNGKTARFWGDLCLQGFTAIADTMEWISPEGMGEVSDSERALLVKEVKKRNRKEKFKITFVDQKGKRL